MDTEGRLIELERANAAMQARVWRLEAVVAPRPHAYAPPPPARAYAPRPQPVLVAAPAPAPSAPARPRVSLEDLLAGRVLAWAGGVAVLIGIVLLFGIAVSRGWIDASARVLLAAGASLALGVLGVWLHDRKGRTDAALAAIATAVAGLFVCDVVAARVYDLIAPTLGIVAAIGIGATATALALRWRAPGIAALGLGGALLAPVLAGAGATAGCMPFLLVAAACATAVCVRERWTWLGAGVLALSAPQWIAWLSGAQVSPGVAAAWMTAFGALGLVAAAGYELRDPTAGLRGVAMYLAAVNALALGFIGGIVLHRLGGDGWTQAWLVALAVAHLGLGLALRGGSRAVRGMLIGLGVALADVAAGLILGGPALTLTWAGGAVAMRVLTRRLEGHERRAAETGLTGQLAIALLQTLAGGAAFGAATGSSDLDVASLVSVIVVASACFACARCSDETPLRRGLDIAAMALLALMTAMTLHGPALAVGWCVEALALARATRGRGAVATFGAVTYLGGGAAVAVGLVLESLPAGAGAPGPAVLAAMGMVVVSALALSRIARDARLRAVLDPLALAAVALTTAAALDGPVLVAAWAAEAVAVFALGALLDDDATRYGAPALLGLGLAHVLLVEAPPSALISGAPDGLLAAAALGALIAGAAAGARRLRDAGDARRVDRAGLAIAAAVLALYLGSVELISALQPDGTDVGNGLGIPVGQLGQMLLSGAWALVGLTALVAGLRRASAGVRRAGLALLVLAMAKVAIFDLATLDSLYRVMSFVALGLLLLAGAFAWQRARPGTTATVQVR